MTPTTAGLLLRGAPVYDAGRWVGDCLAIADGRIAGRGALDDVAHLVGPATEEVDLTGCFLLPAFHDAHVHPVSAGLEMSQCDLTGEGYLARVADYVARDPGREWVTGGGWSMGSFPRGIPSAALLDPVCPDRPVYLPNRDHHSAWVNSRSLALAGIDARTPDPTDGRIERDADGNPVGVLHEGAMALVGDLVPVPDDEQLLEALLAAQAHLHALGIVGWQDALLGEGLGMRDSLPTYLRAQREGRLTAKLVAALWWDRDRGAEQVADLVARREQAREGGFRATSVKIMQDGVCETLTAAVLAEGAGDRQYVVGSLLTSGARLAFGSDWPVSTPDPFDGMHVAVNRREPGEEQAEPLLPGERLTLVEALEAYTAGSAYVNGLEATTGALRVGAAADVVAVDRDVLASAPEKLHEVTVRHTFVDGRQVYGAAGALA